MHHLMDHEATGIVTQSQQFENHDSIFITASLSTVINEALGYHIIKFSEFPNTITLDTHLADFKVPNSEQIKHIQPVDPALLYFMIQHDDTTEVYISDLLKVPQPHSEQETYWFPTFEVPGDPATYTAIQQRVYNDFLELKELKKLNPHDNETSRKDFFQTSNGPIQHTAQTNRKKIKRSSSSFTISLLDIFLISAQIINSK